MYWQFSLASLLAHSNKSPRLILIQKIVEVYGCTVTSSHFGERFRGGQYTMVSCLPHVVLCAQLFVKVWARAPVPWMETQRHTRKHYKTAIQSECIASQGLFPIFCVQNYAQSDTFNSVL